MTLSINPDTGSAGFDRHGRPVDPEGNLDTGRAVWAAARDAVVPGCAVCADPARRGGPPHYPSRRCGDSSPGSHCSCDWCF